MILLNFHWIHSRIHTYTLWGINTFYTRIYTYKFKSCTVTTIHTRWIRRRLPFAGVEAALRKPCCCGADFRDKSLSLALAIVIDTSRSSFLGIGFDQVFENLVIRWSQFHLLFLGSKLGFSEALSIESSVSSCWRALECANGGFFASFWRGSRPQVTALARQ